MPTSLVFPIFPLPGALLVPGGFLPLHIFEPRYRAMVADAVAGNGLIAMAHPVGTPLVEPSLATGDGASAQDRPPVHATVGLGRILRHEPLPDGRSNLLLGGVARMRIEEELPAGKPYRVVRAVPVSERLPPDPAAGASALETLLEVVPSLSDDERAALRSARPGQAADALLAQLPLPAGDRFALFAETDVLRRLDGVRRALLRLAGVRHARDIGPGDPRLN